MADQFDAAGTMTDWKPAEGSAPGRGVIGGVRVTVWPSEFINGEKVGSFTYADIKARVESGRPMKVSGDIQPPREGSERFGPDYVVRNVSDATPEEVAAGDAKTAEKKAARRGGKGAFVPKDESWLAARWAISTALDVMDEIDLTKEKDRKRVQEVASWALGFSQELRDSVKAPSADKPSEVPPGAVTPEQAKDW